MLETNVHFPTDLNLLWDSGRKCLGIIEKLLAKSVHLPGWRKWKHHFRKFRNVYRTAAEIHRRKGANYQERLKIAVERYLSRGQELSNKSHQALKDGCQLVAEGKMSVVSALLLEELRYYIQMLDKHLDLVERRIIKGETIPHSEKLFSIFEPHTEWITKGKMSKKVELGHNVAIASDQYHFILDFEIMFQQSDPEVGLQLGRRLIKRYGKEHTLKSMSFDRGFYSSLVKKELSKEVEQVIMPKKGKKTAAQEEEENAEEFVALRKAHSAVESNINQLEHNGLNRCPDKGEKSYRRYAALGILTYNLQHLGQILIQQDQGSAAIRKKAA